MGFPAVRWDIAWVLEESEHAAHRTGSRGMAQRDDRDVRQFYSALVLRRRHVFPERSVARWIFIFRIRCGQADPGDSFQ